MANLHFRVPVTLDVRLDVDDPVVRVPHWRTWPKENPPKGEDLLLRFLHKSRSYTVIGIFEGADIFTDSVGVTLFCPAGWDEDDLSYDELVFRGPFPDEVRWIPLAELLEGVEDAEVEEQA